MNHERWLVSYSDMVTVLMALFIVMFAISQVDQEKYIALSKSLAAGFGDVRPDAPVDVLDGSRGVMDGMSPHEGQAVDQVATTDPAAVGVVAQTVRAGYVDRERLLRLPQVVVYGAEAAS